jgi:hypothetical protein
VAIKPRWWRRWPVNKQPTFKFNIYSKTKFLILTLKILKLNWINFKILTRHRGFQHCQDSRTSRRTQHLNLTVSAKNLNKNVENLESLELSWLSRLVSIYKPWDQHRCINISRNFQYL